MAVANWSEGEREMNGTSSRWYTVLTVVHLRWQGGHLGGVVRSPVQPPTMATPTPVLGRWGISDSGYVQWFVPLYR